MLLVKEMQKEIGNSLNHASHSDPNTVLDGITPKQTLTLVGNRSCVHPATTAFKN
jgi:hypothetical protein